MEEERRDRVVEEEGRDRVVEGGIGWWREG